MTDLRTQLQSTLGPGYTLERELGGGGVSRVFVARENALGRDVVVKVLSPELAAGLSRERFTREIRLAASLQEPHIVPVLSAGVTTDGLPWFTMPFVAGESLRDRLTRGALPTAEALGILRNVADVIARLPHFLEHTYNNQRQHSALQYRSPNTFRGRARPHASFRSNLSPLNVQL
jgi:serine/threonine-protein kinase